MLDEHLWPTSLKTLFRTALRDFPEHESEIRHYVGELSHVLGPRDAVPRAEVSAAQAADATCNLTGDDPVTLLFKFEEFLESLLVGGSRRGVTRER
jgi:hypothetical protein